jgi:hypothetical protein
MERPLRTAAHEVAMVVRAASPTHQHLRMRLVVLFVTTLVIDLIASTAILALERDQPGTGIHSFGDALFWTSTQLLTVSSQLPNPLSAGARVIDVGLQMWAISVVAMLAGSFGAFFHRRGMERDPL